MSDETTAVCTHEPSLQELVDESREQFGYFVEKIKWKGQLVPLEDELTEEETGRLVGKLDRLRGEPTVSFSTTHEAIDYLRSIARRK